MQYACCACLCLGAVFTRPEIEGPCLADWLPACEAVGSSQQGHSLCRCAESTACRTYEQSSHSVNAHMCVACDGRVCVHDPCWGDSAQTASVAGCKLLLSAGARSPIIPWTAVVACDKVFCMSPNPAHRWPHTSNCLAALGIIALLAAGCYRGRT